MTLLHAHSAPLEADGTVDVWGPARGVARLIHGVFRYPDSGMGQQVLLSVLARGEERIWNRCFNGRRFASVHRFDAHALYERFGPIEIQFKLQLDGQELSYRSQNVRCFGLSVPRLLRPSVLAVVAEADKGWTVDVQVDMARWGLICRYRAVLKAQ